MSNKTYLGSVTRVTRPFILDVTKLRRANAKVTTATAYKAGDLLVLSDANVLTHATDEKTWNVVCGQDVTTVQAMRHSYLLFQCLCIYQAKLVYQNAQGILPRI